MSAFITVGLSGNRSELGLVQVQLPHDNATIDDLLTFQPVTPWGFPEVNRSFSQMEDGTYRLICSMEGLDPNSDPDADGIFEYDSTFREEPIETFPDQDLLKSEYGAYEVEGKLKFPSTLPKSTKGSGLTGKQGSAGDETNELFGTTTYLVLNAIFRHTYLRRSIPNNFLDKAGTTVDELPSGFPTPEGRNWLVMPPKARKRGNVYEIIEELMLSKPGSKWPKALYSLIGR